MRILRKLFCCGSYDRQDFIDTLFCMREIWKRERNDVHEESEDLVWFAEGFSLTIAANWENIRVRGPEPFEDDYYRTDYRQRYDLTIEHREKRIFCCGIQIPCLERESMMCVGVDDSRRWRGPDCESIKEGEDPVNLALKEIKEIRSRVKISRLIFKINESRHSEKMLEEIGKEKIYIPFLLIGDHLNCDISPFINGISFKHLAIRRNEPISLSDKMLECGFLSIFAPIENREKIGEFTGFGLLIGENQRNSMGLEVIFQEIQKWKNKSPSNLRFLGIFNDFQKTKKLYAEEDLEKFLSFSPARKITTEEDEWSKYKIIPLDEVNDAAILIREEGGVCFVREGWQKWKNVLEVLSRASVIHCNDFYTKFP